MFHSARMGDSRDDGARPGKRPAVGAGWRFLAGVIATLATGNAGAHVKWFAAYDLEKPPLPIGDVLTPEFVYLYVVSIFGFYAFFWIDRYLYRIGFLSGLTQTLSLSRAHLLLTVRMAVLVFFTALFLYGIQGHAFLLTPELKTAAVYVPWFQLAIGLCAILPVTTPVTGLGVLLLYALAVHDYGLFHMLDYMIFIGVGVYLLLCRSDNERVVRGRYVTLYAATCLTLLWASVEKWGYAGWTYPLLERDSSLLMGMTPYFYMLLAGFVEFNVTFALLSSASSLARIVAFALNLVFILAIYKFGLVDAVGHMLIITILVVFVLRGPTRARDFLILSNKTLWTEAYFMTGLYILAMNVIILAYYGFHHFAYG